MPRSRYVVWASCTSVRGRFGRAGSRMLVHSACGVIREELGGGFACPLCATTERQPVCKRGLTCDGTIAFDGAPRICELVRYRLSSVRLRGGWTGPGALQLAPHALAPVAELPVLEVRSALHLVADLTLDLGEVAHDYLG